MRFLARAVQIENPRRSSIDVPARSIRQLSSTGNSTTISRVFYAIAGVPLARRPAGQTPHYVGTRDEYHLDAPVALLQQELRSLGSDAEIDFAPGATHASVFDYKGSAIDYIITQACAALAIRMAPREPAERHSPGVSVG